MQSQNTLQLVTAGSIVIPPGHPLPHHAVTVGNLPAGSMVPVSQNPLVWPQCPVNGPHGPPSIVTLPSGQTVYMANYVPPPTCSPLPVSTPSSTYSHPNSPIVISNPTPPPAPIAVPLQTQSVAGSGLIQAPGLPIQLALPDGLQTNPSMTNSTPIQFNTNPSIQLPSQVESVSYTNPGYQTILPSNPVIIDHPTLAPMDPKTQIRLPNSIHPDSQMSSNLFIPPQHPISSMSSLQPDSLITSSARSQPNPNPTDAPLISVASNVQPTPQSSVDHNQSVGHSDAQTSSLSSSPAVVAPAAALIQSPPMSILSQATSIIIGTPVQCLPTSSHSTPPSTAQPTEHKTNTVFTPSSLNKLISDIDPQLQLDPDAHEVLVNLATEFITSVATKAQKLASHRGSSAVEAKDIHFSLERDWDINVPGYCRDERSVKHTILSEAHKQRLALIKKQIKKM